MDGKVRVCRREKSEVWQQCGAYLSGPNHRTTRQTSLALAVDFAREWCIDRHADDRLRRREAVLSPGVHAGPAGLDEPAPPSKPKRAIVRRGRRGVHG